MWFHRSGYRSIKGGEQYKVVSAVEFEGDGFVKELNRLGADGWKVRTGIGNAVILAK
jgi:hypothetical protein